MKTQIITLQSHDDLISVRDRLGWAKTPRILLVWPKGEPISLRSLDLKVLQRQAEALGAQLGIVTRRRWVRLEAEALGLPVFESSAAAQKAAWPAPATPRRRAHRPPRRNLREMRRKALPGETAWRSGPAVRTPTFALGVMAVMALVGVFIPRAVITVYPQTQQQSLVFPVLAAAADGQAGPAEAVATRQQTLELSGERSVPITNRITVPDAPARGQVVFRNLTQKEITIPTGTALYASGEPRVRYTTLETVVLDAGLDKSGESPVEAVQPGAAGNLEAGSIVSIEGPLGLLAAVQNPEPTSGGRDRTVTGAGESDRLALRNALIEELRGRVAGELGSRLGSDALLLPDTVSLSRVLEETYEPPPGKPGTRLSLKLRLEFTASTVAMSDLGQLAEAALNASVPPGFAAAPDSLAFGPASTAATGSDGTTRWEMQAGRTLVRTVSLAQVTEAVRGRSLRMAQAALKAWPWERPPEIRLEPAWWPWMPLLPFRTEVIAR